jgi:cysteine synthase A
MTHQGKPYDSVVQAIGHTPVVALSRLTRDVEGRILAKLEYLNPGFSKKDRIARQIIKAEGENGGRTAAARSDVSGK